MQEVNRFYTATLNSPALLEGVKTLTTADALTDYARQNGFNFSTGELIGFMKQQAEGELAEAQLSQIAGGTTMADSLNAGCSFWEAFYYHAVLKNS